MDTFLAIEKYGTSGVGPEFGHRAFEPCQLSVRNGAAHPSLSCPCESQGLREAGQIVVAGGYRAPAIGEALLQRGGINVCGCMNEAEPLLAKRATVRPYYAARS